MSVNPLPWLYYEDYFWYDVVNEGKLFSGSEDEFQQLKKRKIFNFDDDLKEKERNGMLIHVGEPSKDAEDEKKEDEDENDFLVIKVAESKFMPFVVYSHIELDDEFKLLQNFLLSEELKKMQSVLRVHYAVFGRVMDKNDNETTSFWVICRHCYPELFNDYLDLKLHSDEIKFMIYNLLEIAQDVIKLDRPCVIDGRTLKFVKDSASPFPKLILSPLAFILATMNTLDGNDNEEPLLQIINIFKKLVENLQDPEEYNELIDELRNNQPMDNIMKMEVVQNLNYFVNGPVCSFNEYMLISTLGNGAFGKVMKVKHENDPQNSFFAIKYAKKKQFDNLESLKREAIIMRLCCHLNIIKFYNIVTKESFMGNPCNVSQLKEIGLVMEYCDGGDLSNYIERYPNPLLPLGLIDNIFYQITEAQRYLHFEKRLIHRDIKPQNYLLINHSPYPIIKCCDFGSGRAISTHMDTVMGTPLFCARDIYIKKNRNKNVYTDKSDLYSLGIILYYLTTRQFPFTTDEPTFHYCMKNEKPVQFPLKFQTEEYRLITDLVLKLTKHKEEERMTWGELFKHPYIQHIQPK
ncbi:Protein kinase domain containing protein [Entamoeba marina]